MTNGRRVRKMIFYNMTNRRRVRIFYRKQPMERYVPGVGNTAVFANRGVNQQLSVS